MSANYIYDPYSQSFTDESEVRVEHNLNREVNVSVFIDDEEVFCDVQKSTETGEELTVIYIRFYEKGVAVQKTGKVVVS